MELIAGAHTKEARESLKDLISFFKSVGRIIIPSEMDYEKAGEILARLQKIKGYNLKKCDSITNDCLIAASVRNIGGVLYTQNKKDFQAIKDVFGFKVAFV
jgi:predicted nucleic acid-binding protein